MWAIESIRDQNDFALDTILGRYFVFRILEYSK